MFGTDEVDSVDISYTTESPNTIFYLQGDSDTAVIANEDVLVRDGCVNGTLAAPFQVHSLCARRGSMGDAYLVSMDINGSPILSSDVGLALMDEGYLTTQCFEWAPAVRIFSVPALGPGSLVSFHGSMIMAP